MRITHSMMTRNYTSNLNKNLKNLTQSNEKLSSQRAFNKGWEDVSGANRALRLRALISDNERQQANIDDVRGRYNSAEDNMRAVNDIMNTVSDKLLFANNGTLPDTDREQIAKEIENLQDQMFQIVNVEYAGKHVFSASGNATGAAPFSKDANGKLLYNGTDVDSMVVGADGNAYLPDGVTPVPFNKHSYIDIGMGFQMDANGELDSRTAQRATFSGIEAFGFGTTNGMPNNIHSLLGKISSDVKAGNMDGLTADLNHLKSRQAKLLTNVTDVGTLSSYIDETADRLKNDELNFKTVQNDIEAVPLSEEIMYNKDFEMAWMVTLQLGSKILPPTIFDFIR